MRLINTKKETHAYLLMIIIGSCLTIISNILTIALSIESYQCSKYLEKDDNEVE